MERRAHLTRTASSRIFGALIALHPMLHG